MLQRDLIRQVKLLELITRRKASSRLAGEYHSVFKGRGMDFDEVKPYSPGDDVRFLDWNVSARTGEPYIKRFVEERELTVFIAVDASASMRFGSHEKSKADLVAEMAAVLAFSAIRNNDRVGLIIFSDGVQHFIPAKKGRKHVLRIIRDILGRTTADAPEGRQTDIAGALDFISRVSRRKAVVFMLSDFLAPDYSRALKIAARRHDIVPIMLADPLELELPAIPALIPLRDLEDDRIRWLDLSSRRHREAYQRAIQAQIAERDTLFRRLRLDTVPVDTDEPYIERLILFFRRRAARP